MCIKGVNSEGQASYVEADVGPYCMGLLGEREKGEREC